jgi:hypothetical protein
MTTTNDTTTSQTTNTPAEPSMEEYAAMRMAEMRGEKPAQATAAAADATPPAAATEDQNDDQAAAATDEDDVDGKTTTESATEDETDEEQQPKGSKKGINKRFSELTAEKKAALAAAEQAKAEAEAARREAEQARQEAERLRLEAERAQNAIPKVPEEADDPKPNRMDFEDPDEYAAALAAHTARAEVRKAEKSAREAAEARAAEAREKAKEAQQAQIQKAVQELHSNFQKKVAEAKPEYPDYDEKVTNNESLTLRNDVFFAIEQATDSPHLLYHIANHPEEAASLNQMHPTQVLMRLGELQAELRVARKPKPSKAAEPVRPVGNRQSPHRKTPEEMTTEEYAAEQESRAKASGQRTGRVRIL